MNQALRTYLRERGIDHRVSVTHTSQQNGFIEREIRTVTKCARTLLHKAEVRGELWAEMVNTAVYLLNRTINTNTGNKTPYELWFGRRPRVKSLHPVGCEAALLDQGPRGKFEVKGRELQFISYTDTFNTFSFYEPETSES